MALHTIELCSGVGLLGEGLRSGLNYLGVETRTVCHVEREAYAASILAARMEEGSLDAAPIWSDLCTFDARAWRGKVDCIVAGFPCQDLSVAGKRAGLDGARSGLFFEVCRIATDCCAQFMFLENVGGIASATASAVDETEGDLEERAAARVVGELADLGWDAEWLHLSASDVGASHGRERWFCLAWKLDDPKRIQLARERIHAGSRAGGSGALDTDRPSQQLGDTQHNGRHGSKNSQGSVERKNCDKTGEVSDGQSEGSGDTQLACRELFAPGPADYRWQFILDRDPALAPALEPDFCGVVDGMAYSMDECRASRLRCIGNGVVPLQAAAAFVVLAQRAWIFDKEAA